MLFVGLLLCMISFLVLYTRLSLIISGKSAKGCIIGYGDRTKGMRGMESCNYKVKYAYNGQEHIAKSLESVSVPIGAIPNKNLHRAVTVYFKENKPEVVTIKDFKTTTIIGLAFLTFGILSVLVS